MSQTECVESMNEQPGRVKASFLSGTQLTNCSDSKKSSSLRWVLTFSRYHNKMKVTKKCKRNRYYKEQTVLIRCKIRKVDYVAL